MDHVTGSLAKNTPVTSSMNPSSTSLVRALNLIPCTAIKVMNPTVSAASRANGTSGTMRWIASTA
jgi:hypothetical protein